MLKLQNVTKIYTTKAGDTKALNNINLTFPDKGMVFITGKSGSGKTTMLNIIGGLDGVTEGEIIIDGKAFSTFSAKEFDSYRNTYIGFIFQEYNLLNDFSVSKNVEMANELQGKKTDDESLNQVFTAVGIEEYARRKPNELSGGQRQRVAIARALIKNPKVIMADEPTGALDSNTGVQVMDTLKKLSSDKLVLVISHDLELAERYADRIITIKDGKIQSDVTITTEELQGNVFDSDKGVSVKGGADLTDEEIEVLLKAIKQKKKVDVNDSIIVKKKENTKEIKEDKSDKKKVELISSKMKFKSSALLGLKSLNTKPIRLIFTIFLAVIAFSVFGIFDTVASYSSEKMLSNALINSGYKSVSMTSSFYHDADNYYQIRISQEDIDAVNKKTGLKFRGVYEIDDEEAINNGDINFEQLNTKFSTKYYKKGLNGILEFKEDEIDRENFVVGKDSFNYKLIHGEYPKGVFHYDASGNVDGYQVAITKYFAEVIVQLKGYGSYGFRLNSSSPFINSMEDFVGQYVNVTSRKKMFITGVVDCGSIPAKYDVLKDAESTKNIETLINDFETYLHSAPHQCLFVSENFVNEYMREDGIQRSALYYSENGALSLNDVPQSLNFVFGTDALTKYNTLTLGKELFDAEGNCLLEDGETVVNIKELKNIYYNDIYIKSLQANGRRFTTDVNNYIKNLNKLSNENYGHNGKQDDLLALWNIFKETVKEYPELNLEKTVKVVKEISGRKVEKTVTLKIVGFYDGNELNKDIIIGRSPVVMTANDMEALDIYSNQGIYARVISPVGSKDQLSSAVDYMTTTSGLRLTWFGNEIIESIEYYEVQVQQFFNIFLYASLILALFSIFMLFNYISTSIASKRQTIGILRALGSCGKDIFIMFAIESLIIAIINGIFASLLTGIGSLVVNKYIREIMNISLDFSYFSGRQVLLIFLFSVVTAIISSIIPIVRISKEKPVDLIRKE